MSNLHRFVTIALLAAGAAGGLAQTNDFDVDSYKQFLATHQTLSAAALQAMHPAGEFGATIPLIPLAQASTPCFSDNASWVNELPDRIRHRQPAEIPLFATSTRLLDFSQLTAGGMLQTRNMVLVR
jgi:hypothetical protein